MLRPLVVKIPIVHSSGHGPYCNGIFLGMGPWGGWGYSHGWGSHRFVNEGGGHYHGGSERVSYHTSGGQARGNAAVSHGGARPSAGHAAVAHTSASHARTSAPRATASHATASRAIAPHAAATRSGAAAVVDMPASRHMVAAISTDH